MMSSLAATSVHGPHEPNESNALASLLGGIVAFTPSRLLLAFGLALAIVFARAPLTKVPDALFVSDGFGYYIYLPSLVIDHDLDFSNQVTRLPYEGTKQFYHVASATSRHTNQFPIGCAIFWLPFFVVADMAVLSLNALGTSIPRTGFGFAYELPVYLGSFAYGLLGIWFLQKTLRQLFDRTTADLGLLAILFATPVGYYLWFELNMSHSVALMLVAWWIHMLLDIDLNRDTRLSRWIQLGAVLGLINLIRPYNGVLGLMAIPVALHICSVTVRRFVVKSLWAAFWRLSVCFLVSLLMLAPQVVVWRVLYGSWFVVPKGSGYEAMSWWGPDFADFVTSIFALWPVYLIAFVGLVGSVRFQRASDGPSAEFAEQSAFVRRVGPWSLLVLFAIIYLVASSRDWMLGTAFGQRRMVDWTALLAMGLCVALAGLRRRISITSLSWASVVLVAANAALIVIYLFTDLIREYGRVL